jgi:hypothetical protein
MRNLSNSAPSSAHPLYLRPDIEGIGHPRLSYKVDNLDPFTLPDDLSADVAAQRVRKSLIQGKKLVIDATVSPALTPLEDAALRWAVAALAAGDDGGKEWRAVLPLGPGQSPPVGQVIFGYDEQLNARATLVGRGLATGGHTEKITDQQARVALLAQYRLSAITGPWRDGELAKVLWALALLAPAERSALAGVALVRVQELPAELKGTHTQATFFHVSGPIAADMGTIYVADRTFADDARGFYAGTDGLPACPPSFQVILHEAGHAIDTAVRRARSRENAEFALTSAGLKYGPGEPIPEKDIDSAIQIGFKNIAAEQAVPGLAVDAFNAVNKKTADADRLISESQQLGGIMATLAEQLKDKQAGKPDKPARDQVALIKRELAGLEEVFEFIRDKINPVLDSAQPERLMPSSFDTARNALNGLDHEPWMKFHQAVMRWCVIQQRAATWRQTYVKNGKKTTGRRTAFKAYALEKKISEDLTEYSDREWPASPEEFLCEALAIWRVDPPAIGRHSKALSAYFENNLHLADE